MGMRPVSDCHPRGSGDPSKKIISRRTALVMDSRLRGNDKSLVHLILRRLAMTLISIALLTTFSACGLKRNLAAPGSTRYNDAIGKTDQATPAPTPSPTPSPTQAPIPIPDPILIPAPMPTPAPMSAPTPAPVAN